MKKLMSKTGLIAASALIALTSVLPATGMPLPSAKQPISSEVQLVRDSSNGPDRIWPRRFRNREFRDNDRRNFREVRRNREWSEGHWNGHRGYRYHRPGYRRYDDGFWYPLAAFGAGVAIGNVISRPRVGNSNVRWCANRYVSYRASDNTFKPNRGPRRQCVSPYM